MSFSYSQPGCDIESIKHETLWTKITNPKTFHDENLAELKRTYPNECSKFSTFVQLVETLINSQDSKWSFLWW